VLSTLGSQLSSAATSTRSLSFAIFSSSRLPASSRDGPTPADATT
jgi:hypothetical protein